MKKKTVVDLFCGAGGLSKGFLDAGYNVVLGVDYDESALKTFQNNHGTATAMKLDLYNHDNITCIVDFLKDNNIENLDVLVGGPPCQGFSYAGKMDINDKRNFLYLAMVKLTEKLKPKSWEKKEDKKYFLILDDISRGAISGILGDMLPLIEPHGQTTYKTVLSDGETISVSPNVYIIATRSTLIDSVEQMNYGFLRHFYEYQLNNDYMYMCDSATDVYSDYDMSANAMFYRTKRIVTDYLRHRYQMSSVEKERYVIGHGMYKDTGTAMIARNQIIPLLRQYVKDNVLAKTANVSIAALQKLVDGQYSKDRTLADVNRIVLQKTGITADSFRSEGLTHQPLVNLVSRIKEQGLVDDTDIANDIMFNPQVVVRKKAKLDKVERDFPTPGYLYIEKSNRDIYTYGTTKNKSGATKRPRFFYSGSVNDAVSVDGIDYAIASEMQPGEYSRWYEELDSGNEENERYSSSPNSIMFRILRSYYRALSKHYGGYLSEYPGDENIARLKAYAEQEYKHLVSESRKLHPEVSDEKEVNAKANDDFRDVIHDLVLFWKDRGETISVGGQTILVEGVYKVDSSKRYEEYSRAMETLGIHQMIMQGPPGTSKTYSAREYLKYEACKVNGSEISDSDLDALQIMDYKEGATISSWAKDNVGKTPGIAWDIVQFHPSYGYEDFVRGIEVGTIKTEHGSNVSYETVNKILGKIAEVASRKEYEKTKFYLVIDEINRANLATVFGELIYGLEYRGRSVATPSELAKSMGLSVKLKRITEDCSIFGQIFFQDSTAEIYDEKLCQSVEEEVPAKTILVDPETYFLIMNYIGRLCV